MKSCRGSAVGVCAYRIPKDPKIHRLWIEAIAATADNETMRVCCNHFGEVDFQDPGNPSKGLKLSAVPSLRLHMCQW